MNARIRRNLPNVLTLANLVAGVLALGAIVQGRPLWQALTLMAVALLCDLLDGRMARRFGADGPMGAQLDSLADLISFGLVPAAAAYTWFLGAAGPLGILAPLALVAAAAWRLARFNVQAMLPKAEPVQGEKPAFTGVPVTIPAAIVFGVAGAGFSVPPLVAALAVLGLAWAMVSTLSFRSFKEKPLPMLAVPMLGVVFFTSLALQSPLAGLSASMALVGLAFIMAGVLQSAAQ